MYTLMVIYDYDYALYDRNSRWSLTHLVFSNFRLAALAFKQTSATLYPFNTFYKTSLLIFHFDVDSSLLLLFVHPAHFPSPQEV